MLTLETIYLVVGLSMVYIDDDELTHVTTEVEAISLEPITIQSTSKLLINHVVE